MEVDVSIFISFLSLIVAITMCVINMINAKRNRKHDDRQEATELTTLLVKLENINNGITEIKSDMRTMSNDMQQIRDRLIVVEQSTKSAHHRIDKLEGKE